MMHLHSFFSKKEANFAYFACNDFISRKKVDTHWPQIFFNVGHPQQPYQVETKTYFWVAYQS